MVRTAALALMLALALGPGGAAPATASPGTIEDIRVLGLYRMSREAFLYALGLEVGEPWDVERVRSRLPALWNRKLFTDITFEVEDGPQGGKVLIVKVEERPQLSSITYDDSKVVTKTQIEDRYRERGVDLDLGKPLDMGQVFFAESAIRDLLAERGFLDSRVEADIRRVTETTRSVHFTIDEGGKTRIRDIEFVGNELFSDRKLKSRLRFTGERKWYWPWSKKNLYHPIKWDQDVANIRDLYQNGGYLDVEVRPPVIEVHGKTERREEKRREGAGDAAAGVEQPDEPAVEEPLVVPGDEMTPKQIAKLERRLRKERKKADKRAKKKSKAGKRWVELTVPVVEGPQYRLGEVTFAGNEKFRDELLRSLVPLRDGSVLSNGIVELGVNRITRLYEDAGHLYVNVVRRIQRHEDETVADVEIAIDEDVPYTVSRIEFRGNSQTRDRVLRRESQLMEGDLFNRTRLERSRAKINQLGYFQTEEPVIEPLEDDSVRIVFPGQEQGRNEIQVGGGYSGLDGAFFNGVYSTRNFLGRGQIVSTAIQIGGRSDRYQISFQEPWFLNRPYLLGVSLFRRDIDYGSSLRSTSEGGGLVLGKRLSPFSRLDLGYNYESVSSTTFARGVDLNTITFTANNKISSLTPVFAFNTVNNPYRPSRGRSLNFSMQVAGGALGGNTDYVKPVFNFTQYLRGFGRNYFGIHFEGGLVRAYADGTTGERTSAVEGVPRFQRFWLGGDTLGPRVFETRTITPLRYVVLDENGQIGEVLGDPRFLDIDDLVAVGGVPALIEVGGDRFYLVQTEFVVPFNEQAELAFFVDAGDALFEDTSLGFDTMRASAGLELRFHLPIFPVPLRLIYGYPLRELRGDDTTNFTFSIGRSF